MNINKLQKQWLSIPRVIRWPILGVVLSSAGATLYGVAFAGLDAAFHRETARILTTIAYFATCGAIAGGLAGAFVALIDRAESYNPSDNDSSMMADKENDGAAAEGSAPLSVGVRDSERMKYVEIVSRLHWRQFNTRETRILRSQVPRARPPYLAWYMESRPWNN